ncbi:MAG: hypothetical protein SFV81_14255 [Pirellulaceae bacterium]|nr:hypothetical protein [Pirellulaceae bacterium]
MQTQTLTSRISTTSIWVARLGALASIGLLSLFVIGSIQSGDPVPTLIEAVGIACFPVGVVVGMIIGWRQPLVGAIVSLISLFAFYVWSYLVSGRMNNGPYFLLFTLPAVFYLLGALTSGNPSRSEL